MALHLVTHVACGGAVCFVDTEAPVAGYILTPYGMVGSYRHTACANCGVNGYELVSSGLLIRDLSPHPVLKAHAILARLRSRLERAQETAS